MLGKGARNLSFLIRLTDAPRARRGIKIYSATRFRRPADANRYLNTYRAGSIVVTTVVPYYRRLYNWGCRRLPVQFRYAAFCNSSELHHGRGTRWAGGATTRRRGDV